MLDYKICPECGRDNKPELDIKEDMGELRVPFYCLNCGTFYDAIYEFIEIEKE